MNFKRFSLLLWLILLLFGACKNDKANTPTEAQRHEIVHEQVDSIIQAINKSIPADQNPQIFLDAVDKGTVFLEILNPIMLTQNMGSEGAKAYMKKVVSTLTNYNGINSVNFKFPEGNHAQPGTYSMKDFE